MPEDKHFEALLDNEKEWRRALWKKVTTIENRVNNLFIKTVVMAATFGSLSALITTYLNGKK